MRLVLVMLLVAACGDDGKATNPDGKPADASIDAVDIPANTWTWVEIPGNVCANGSQTGIGINVPATPSGDLYVYFEGGGACWDYETCFTLKTAVNIENDYDAAKFQSTWGANAVDRSGGNPFANATLVVVPYCTGDLHAGIETRTYTSGAMSKMVHHHGSQNAQSVVDWLHQRMPDASRVWIAGSSAGGYGATLNHHRFEMAWPSLEVPLLQDSSPFVPVLAGFSTWQSAWSLQFPPGCTGCSTDFRKVIDNEVAAYPNSRIGLLHFDDDAVIKQYFGYAATAGSLVSASNELLDNHYNHPLTKAFVVAGAGHTMFGEINTRAGLALWITQWATGDAQWATVRP